LREGLIALQFKTVRKLIEAAEKLEAKIFEIKCKIIEMKFFIQKCKILPCLFYFDPSSCNYFLYYILKYYFIKLIFGNKDESKYSACGRLTP
jgi:hypothetical protein